MYHTSYLSTVAVVGLERTIYRVSEDVGVVELCAIVFSPSSPCPISFPFSVILSTDNDSAGTSTVDLTLHHTPAIIYVTSAVAPMDYGHVATLLSFDACEMRRCVNVTIVNDVVLENVESFDVTLDRAPELDSRITLSPVDGIVEIIDNDGMFLLSAMFLLH